MSDTPEGRQPSALPHGEPCVVVIFGASGDLTKRKLIPALFHLACTGCLTDNFLPSALRTMATNGAPSASPGATAMPEGGNAPGN